MDNVRFVRSVCGTASLSGGSAAHGKAGTSSKDKHRALLAAHDSRTQELDFAEREVGLNLLNNSIFLNLQKAPEHLDCA